MELEKSSKCLVENLFDILTALSKFQKKDCDQIWPVLIVPYYLFPSLYLNSVQ